MSRIFARTGALAVGDATALVVLRPRWEFVATGLSHPASWLAAVGADVALAAVCVLVLWLAAVWIGVGLVAGLGARLPGVTGRVCARFARVVVPKVLVRVVLGSAGLGLLATPAAHAMALPHAAPAASVRTSMTAASPWTGDDVPSPTWPVSPPAAPPVTSPPVASTPMEPPTWPAASTPTSPPTSPSPAGPAGPASTPTRLPTPVPPTSRTPAHRHPSTPASPHSDPRVHRGDSLWLLAAHRLGPHAADGDIADYWPQIYAANRSVIGDDPSVIHPGQVLDLPTPTQESS